MRAPSRPCRSRRTSRRGGTGVSQNVPPSQSLRIVVANAAIPPRLRQDPRCVPTPPAAELPTTCLNSCMVALRRSRSPQAAPASYARQSADDRDGFVTISERLAGMVQWASRSAHSRAAVCPRGPGSVSMPARPRDALVERRQHGPSGRRPSGRARSPERSLTTASGPIGTTGKLSEQGHVQRGARR
jgi:hypothetical protein